MTKYRVTSDRLAGYAAGDTVSADDLASCNVEALVASGHLSPQKTTSKKNTEPDTEGLTTDG